MLKSHLLEIIANGENSLATREQQARLFATGGLLHMEVLPVSGTSIESMDIDRVRDYLVNVMRDPEAPANSDEWQRYHTLEIVDSY